MTFYHKILTHIQATDIYAMGISLFIMTNGRAPFDETLYERNQILYIKKQREREYQFNAQYNAHYNDLIEQLIYLLLEPKPGVRLTATDALAHKALLP